MLSLIITVKNEIKQLPEWLSSVGAQSVQPDEIIIVDGGSTDGTWEWLRSVATDKIKVFQKPGNIASGRNFAVGEAKGDLIAVTDAGCVYNKDWLKKLIELVMSGKSKFSTTAFRPLLKSDDSTLVRLIAGATIPTAPEFAKDWLPSSRSVAFEKSAWSLVGGYPEWLPFCEDVLFDLALEKKGIKPAYVRETLVSWRPRLSVWAYLRQVYNYTRSDGHASLFLNRQFIRFAVYGGLLLAIIFASSYLYLCIFMVAVFGSAYMRKYWKRWIDFSREQKKPFLAGLIILPVIIFIGDLAKMWGYLVGVGERVIGRYKKT